MSLRGNVNEDYAVNFVKNLKYDLKRGIICGQVLSLKYVTVSEIAHALWRNDSSKMRQSEIGFIDKTEICDEFGSSEIIAIYDEIHKYAKEIKKKIPDLNIPKMWKKILEEFIYLMKKEVLSLIRKAFIKFSSVGDFLILWDNLCWTQQVTIDRVGTAVKIIDNSNLSIMGKYVLACENCLKDKIRYFYKLLPEDFITEFEIKIKEYSGSSPNYLVLFWTYYIEEKQEKCSNFIGSHELYSFLFDYSIDEKKETAVQYIWENFSNEEMEVYFSYQFMHDFYSNIRFYLFQQLSEIQQEEKIEKVLYSVFRNVRNVLRWHNAFGIEKYVLGVIKSKNVLNAFKIVMSCANKGLLDLIEYATLWDEFIFTRKSELENNFKDICNEFFSPPYKNLNRKYYKITYSSLLRAGASRDIKAHMYTEAASEACNQLISYLGSDILEDILDQAFETEEVVSEFRKHLFSTMGREICLNLIKNSEYEQVNKFLNKYCDEKVITDFKENLAYSERGLFVYLIPCRISPFHDPVAHMDSFICWAFEDNKEKIFTYKSKAFDLEGRFQNNVRLFLQLLKIVIEAKKWDRVEKYFEWIYTATADKVCSAEDIFSHIKKILFRIFVGPLKLSFHYIGYYGLIKRFICCFKQNEIKDLKEQYSKMDLYFNIYEVMRYCKYEEIDDLLDWCFSSDKDKIDEFKLSFMFSFGKLYLFNRIQWHLFNIREVTGLFKWIKPSTASANLFKEKFMTFMRSIKEGKVKEVGSKDEKEWAVINENLTESFEVLSNCVIRNGLGGEQNQIVAHQEVIRKSDLINEKILELNLDYLNEIEIKSFDIEKAS